jgi:hypothetical protein
MYCIIRLRDISDHSPYPKLTLIVIYLKSMADPNNKSSEGKAMMEPTSPDFILRGLKPNMYFLVVPKTQLSLTSNKFLDIHSVLLTLRDPMPAITWITTPTPLPLFNRTPK